MKKPTPQEVKLNMIYLLFKQYPRLKVLSESNDVNAEERDIRGMTFRGNSTASELGTTVTSSNLSNPTEQIAVLLAVSQENLPKKICYILEGAIMSSSLVVRPFHRKKARKALQKHLYYSYPITKLGEDYKLLKYMRRRALFSAWTMLDDVGIELTDWVTLDTLDNFIDF